MILAPSSPFRPPSSSEFAGLFARLFRVARHADLASPAQRALGAYLGFAVGDALGATVEFMTAAEIRAEYGIHRNIVGGGWLRLKPGRVTDDTEMCLALGGALLAAPGWDLRRVADGFGTWLRSRPVDVGQTCRRGIRRYLLEGTLSADPAEDSAGNGAAMRHLPLALATLGDPDVFADRAVAQAHITHHHPFSDAAVVTLGHMTQQLVAGLPLAMVRDTADRLVQAHPQFRYEPWPGRTTGYIVDTVQTVFDAFFGTFDFESCVLRAVNHGGDADTAGALAAQLAGARYGVTAIPARWVRRLNPAVHVAIRAQTTALLRLAGRSP